MLSITSGVFFDLTSKNLAIEEIVHIITMVEQIISVIITL